ncbi:MAG: response regulator transcription factor, partial [Thermomicrobiales bacterium]
MKGAEMRRIRVLIVDDYELVRAGLRTLLAADPEIEVVAEAANGTQALGEGSERGPKVVIKVTQITPISLADVLPK